MDAFFAAVEVLDDPGLRGRAVIVGGTGRRGVVASCSYEARSAGVHSAMPSAQARRACPGAHWRAPRHDRYRELSDAIHAIFHRFTPLVEGVSLDEAFLDVTGARRLFGTGPEIAAAVRRAVAEGVGLTCSVGVAPNKLLAKLASEAAKPRATTSGVLSGPGVVVVEAGHELAFLHPLAVTSLWGVGPATAAKLHRLGITTVGSLAATPLSVVEHALGPAAARHLHALASGVDDRPVEPDRETKSLGHEETFGLDRWDSDGLAADLARMADRVATGLRRAGLAGRTVTVKVRAGDFTTRTRSRTLPGAVDQAVVIAETAQALFRSVELDRGVRLLGVSVSSLEVAGVEDPPEQLRLDLEPPSSRPAQPPGPAGRSARGVGPTSGRAHRAVPGAALDAVRARFGPDALRPASSVDRPAAGDAGPGGSGARG